MDRAEALRFVGSAWRAQRPELDITEISCAVGYPRLSHVSPMFPRETGMSPRAFRRTKGIADG